MNQDYKRNASLADTFLYMPFNIENLKIEISVLIKNYRFLRKSFLQKIFGEKFLETDIEEMPEELPTHQQGKEIHIGQLG